MPQETIEFKSGCLTPSFVRDSIKDTSPEDNPVTGDLEFTEGEILHAMKLAVLDIRDVLPSGLGNFDFNCLPLTKYTLHAVVANLYQTMADKLARRLVSMKGSGLEVNTTEAKMSYYLRESEKRYAEFYRTAQDKKVEANLQDAWGTF
jgi:hypothetical protein